MMMKTTILCLFMLFGFIWITQAQDMIIRKDGSEIKAKVLEVTPDQVKYKNFDNLDGPVYSESKRHILKIKYVNGTEDVFVKENNAAAQDNIVWQPAQKGKKVKKVRYSGLIEALPYVGYNTGKHLYFQVGSNSETSQWKPGISINTTHGIQLMDKYFFGFGIGFNIQSEDELYIPFYTTFALDLSHAPARPFVSFSLGLQLGIISTDYLDGTYTATGLWSNVMIGYKFKSKFYLAGGLTIQNAYFDGYDYSYNYNLDGEEVFSMVGAMVSVGVKF